MDKDKANQDNKNLENINQIKVFYNNPTLSFISKKAEKISCALHLITNHLSENEPIKWLVRESSLVFIKDILSLSENFSNDLSVFYKLRNKVAELTSFLGLLGDSGLISKMNHDILSEELIKISKFLEPEYDLNNYPGALIKEDFFNVGYNTPQEKQTSQEGEYFLNKLNYGYFNKSAETKDFNKGHSKRHLENKDMSFIKMSHINSEKTKNNESSNNNGSKRKQEILSFIKDKKEVTIKDIISQIKGFSEKTLQRDLVALVVAGVLKREGERRWSKYMLA